MPIIVTHKEYLEQWSKFASIVAERMWSRPGVPEGSANEIASVSRAFATAMMKDMEEEKD